MTTKIEHVTKKKRKIIKNNRISKSTEKHLEILAQIEEDRLALLEEEQGEDEQ